MGSSKVTLCYVQERLLNSFHMLDKLYGIKLLILLRIIHTDCKYSTSVHFRFDLIRTEEPGPEFRGLGGLGWPGFPPACPLLGVPCKTRTMAESTLVTWSSFESWQSHHWQSRCSQRQDPQGCWQNHHFCGGSQDQGPCASQSSAGHKLGGGRKHHDK